MQSVPADQPPQASDDNVDDGLDDNVEDDFKNY